MENDSYSEIGSLLAKGRKAMNMSVEEVARAVHIRARYVEALEQGKLGELPGLIYTRGYLQVYAAYLGLDKDEILRRFEQIEGMIAKRGFYFPQVFSKRKTPSREVIWGGLGAALLVYVLWLAISQPASLSTSIVETFPDKKEAFDPKDVACLSAQDVYYPPCTAVLKEEASLLPLPDQINSVMELAH